MAIFESVNKIVDDLCLRSGDTLRRNKGLFLNCAADVYKDMEISVLKTAKRAWFEINKRTYTVDLPCTALQLSGVSIEDEYGTLYPVYRNTRLHRDIVDISAAKDCACEYKCGHSLCNMIKSYEAIEEVTSELMPDDTYQDFTSITRRGVMGDMFYEEKTYPVRVYESSQWVGVELKTETTELCKVEITEDGCICDTDANMEAICNCSGCGNSNPNICYGGNAQACGTADEWVYFCGSPMDTLSVQCGNFFSSRTQFNNIYNVDELGNKLIFPYDFAFRRVLVRWYDDVSLKNIQVPFMAKNAFMKGLQWYASQFNDGKQKLSFNYGKEYAAMKFGVLQELNKYRIAELKMITTPPAQIPEFYPSWYWNGWAY